MVKVGNILYFMYILIAFILLLTFYFCLKNKSKTFQYNFILFLSLCNLFLHFAKLAFPPYCDDLPNSIRKITFENICAVSTILLPFIIRLKKVKIFNNYFFFIALIGGLSALFYPTEAFNKPAFCFDTIRFYYCHISLFIIPCLIGMLHLYIPDYKKAWQIPIMFLLIECLILLNEFVLFKVGYISSSITEFFSRETRNSSFIFGPLPAFDSISKVLTIFTPRILMQNIFNIPNLDTFYFPILWLVIPCFIYLPIIYEITILPFTLKKRFQDEI